MKISKQSVELIDVMGTDLSVVNAARVSFHKISEKFSEGDEKLVRYLAKHNHWTPFAHCFASFRIKAPIFVARQLVKHQVGLAWNEVSRRYVDEEPEFWFPEEWRGRPVNAKQGSSGTVDSEQPSGDINTYTRMITRDVIDLYKWMLDVGVAPEQARLVLPQNTMTEWIWSGSLAAFARVCKLRLDPHAQAETTEVAQMIADQLSPKFPVSFSVLLDN